MSSSITEFRSLSYERIDAAFFFLGRLLVGRECEEVVGGGKCVVFVVVSSNDPRVLTVVRVSDMERS